MYLYTQVLTIHHVVDDLVEHRVLQHLLCFTRHMTPQVIRLMLYAHTKYLEAHGGDPLQQLLLQFGFLFDVDFGLVSRRTPLKILQVFLQDLIQTKLIQLLVDHDSIDLP